MSVGTSWIAASDAYAEALLAEDDDEFATLWLDGVGEVDLLALAGVLPAPYFPEAVLETKEGGVVLRVPEVFLQALAVLEESEFAGIAVRWGATGETRDHIDDSEIVSLLGDMASFARQALRGPGVLAVPMF
jgi:hypothetical protein